MCVCVCVYLFFSLSIYIYIIYRVATLASRTGQRNHLAQRTAVSPALYISIYVCLHVSHYIYVCVYEYMYVYVYAYMYYISLIATQASRQNHLVLRTIVSPALYLYLCVCL